MPLVRVAHVTTVPLALMFLEGQAAFMRARGIELVAISSPGEELDRYGVREGVQVHAIPMERRITPFRDVLALTRLVARLRALDPDVVHAHTPKGGLLGTIAACLAGVPTRIYHMRGLPFTTATGVRRVLLVTSERVACLLATRVLCVSSSLREVALAEGICAAGKLEVLGSGSGQGVDVARFDRDRVASSRLRVRGELGISDDALVFGFVGRIVRDKGIHELAEAWTTVRERRPDAQLVLVGPHEPQDPIDAACRERLERDPRVHLLGMRRDLPELYVAMDVVVLPTYREGFPNVPLEAAAMQLPVIATLIPGCVDAVRDGETGRLVPPRDAVALAQAMLAYAADPAERQRDGAAGRARVEQEFRRDRVWATLADVYRDAAITSPRSQPA
jgi:glycosyltransferase involved in cell wall biosynthesis